jgi:hypothetical protein
MSFVIAATPFMQVNFMAQGGGEITAFATTPSPHARDVMRDHSIVFRAGSTGFSLYYLANPEASAPPVAAIARRTRFSFHLRLLDRDFFTRFHPDFPSGAPQLALDNLDAASSIDVSGSLSAGATIESADTSAADIAAAGVIDLYWDQPQTAVPATSGAVFNAVFRPRA